MKVKEAGKIRSITRRAGGVGREVEVNDIKGRPIVFHSDTINLHSSIKRVKEVKGGVLYISGDKEGYTPTTPTFTVFSDEGIARERFWLGGGGEFSFLKANNRNFTG